MATFNKSKREIGMRSSLPMPTGRQGQALNLDGTGQPQCGASRHCKHGLHFASFGLPRHRWEEGTWPATENGFVSVRDLLKGALFHP
jgi:hypothetical protein